MTLGQKIIVLRALKNETQEEMAKKLDLSRATISNLETGHMPPSESMIEKLAEHFEITPEELTNLNISPISLVKTDDIAPGVKALALSKTPETIKKEEQIATLPTSGERLTAMQEVYHINNQILSQATNISIYKVAKAGTSYLCNPVTALQFAKAFDTEPLYFIDGIEQLKNPQVKPPVLIQTIANRNDPKYVENQKEALRGKTAGIRLKNLRSVAKISTREVAKLTGILNGDIIAFESDDNEFTEAERQALGKLFDVDPNAFMDTPKPEAQPDKPEVIPEPSTPPQPTVVVKTKTVAPLTGIESTSKLLSIAQLLEQIKLMYDQNNVSEETEANLTAILNTLHMLSKGLEK